MPSPEFIANVICNLPSKLREYVLKGVPGPLLMQCCLLLKNRIIQKKDFTKAIQAGYDVWVVEQAEEKAKRDALVGFEPGTKKVCNCEYWVGVIVEVVKTEWKDDRHIVHVLHQGNTYAYFKPEWLESA